MLNKLPQFAIFIYISLNCRSLTVPDAYNFSIIRGLFIWIFVLRYLSLTKDGSVYLHFSSFKHSLPFYSHTFVYRSPYHYYFTEHFSYRLAALLRRIHFLFAKLNSSIFRFVCVIITFWKANTVHEA